MGEARHGHDVMEMMATSGKQYTKASLEEAIYEKFGKDTRFYTCSDENMTAVQLIAFLEQRGKFIGNEDGFESGPTCNH